MDRSKKSSDSEVKIRSSLNRIIYYIVQFAISVVFVYTGEVYVCNLIRYRLLHLTFYCDCEQIFDQSQQLLHATAICVVYCIVTAAQTLEFFLVTIIVFAQ